MANPLQEQLLKAGLIKKAKLAEVTRQQSKARHAKGGKPAPDTASVDAARRQAERAERDRTIAAQNNERARDAEKRAQARQIIDSHRVEGQGEIEYGFTDGDRIKRLPVDADQRDLLARGALVIARFGDSYALLPRAAAAKVRERDASLVVLDHGQENARPTASNDEDDYYSRFKVPDDLIW